MLEFVFARNVWLVVITLAQNGLARPENMDNFDDLEKLKMNISTHHNAISFVLDSSEDYISTCETQSRTFTPNVMANINNENVVILNTINFNQTITVAECINKNSRCSAEDYKDKAPICRQQFAEITLKIVKDGKISNDYFSIPNYCSCQMVKIKKKFLKISG